MSGRKQELQDLLADAERQERQFYLGYSEDDDPMHEANRILERQIAILKALISEQKND